MNEEYDSKVFLFLSFACAALVGCTAILTEKFIPFWTGSIVFVVLPVSGTVVYHGLKTRTPFAIEHVLQVIRFALSGGVSTLIELALLNALFLISGKDSGIWFSIFKGCTFIIGVINSYLLNKYWVFRFRETGFHFEFPKFLLSNLVGLGINVGTASIIVNAIGPLWGIGSLLWANIGAGTAVIVTMFWNFLSYKYFVFRKS